MKNVKYVISEEMKNLVNAFEKVGYEVEVNSEKQLCHNGSFYYNRYCTTITINQEDNEGNYYSFLFTPDGKLIKDFDFNKKYCEKIKNKN